MATCQKSFWLNTRRVNVHSNQFVNKKTKKIFCWLTILMLPFPYFFLPSFDLSVHLIHILNPSILQFGQSYILHFILTVAVLSPCLTRSTTNDTHFWPITNMYLYVYTCTKPGWQLCVDRILKISNLAHHSQRM